MFLLDTNIMSDMVRQPQSEAVSRLAAVGDHAVVTSVIVAGALRYGCLKRGSQRLTERVEAVLREIEVLGLDPAVAQTYGAIRAELKGIGQPIGQTDLWIAAQARTLGMVLVPDNEREFRRVSALRVENWLSG